MTKNQGCEKITKCNPIQHSDQSNSVRPPISKAAVIKNGQEIEDDESTNDLPVRASHTFLLQAASEGKHQRHSHNENEQGKNEVVKCKSGPILMVQLCCQSRDECAAAQGFEGIDEIVGAQYPEHVEAPKRVYGDRKRERLHSRHV